MNWKIVTQLLSIIIILTACTGTTITAPASTSTPTETLVPTPTLTSTSLPPTATPIETLTPTPTGPPSEIIQQGAKMALIPAGKFLMGLDADTALAECQKQLGETCERKWFEDEEPVHQVYLDDYYIDLTEVTNTLYAACVQAGACTPPGDSSSATRSSYYRNPDYDHYPVIWVDWNQARAYCQWRGGDLPTEAQWEKAARGGLEGKLYPWGNEAPVCQKGATNGAKFADHAGCDLTDTEPAGSYAPNGYGLYDMAGNVWEWVLDWYQEDYYGSQTTWSNPIGPTSGDSRVERGGMWANEDVFLLRSAFRHWMEPTYRDFFIGFRCARSP
jgi:eukaryotic-like serine/threonine-protein kinase